MCAKRQPNEGAVLLKENFCVLQNSLCLIIGFRVGNSPIWLPSHSASVGILQCRANQASVAGTSGQHRATCAGVCVCVCVCALCVCALCVCTVCVHCECV